MKESASNQLLITALVIAYNSGDYIFEALDSVLFQDYPRIELIVSNDCSDDFDVEAISRYIESHKKSNIERLVVRKNSRNLGTVKHLEGIRADATGDIEIALASDDRWHDERVFSDFAQRFDELGSDALFITSQVEMRNSSLDTVIERFVTPSVRQMLLNGDMHSLRDLETYRCCIPGAGSAFRREFFERIGKLSDQYTIVEDWTSHIRWLMMGEKIFFLDRTTLIHRAGGISHSEGAEFPPHYRNYREDIKNFFLFEIEPNRNRISPHAFEAASELFRYNDALCLSLDHLLTAIIPLNRRSDDELLSIVSAACGQSACNYEIVFCCPHDTVDQLISQTNTLYLHSQRIRRIMVITSEEWDDAAREKATEAARGDVILTIEPDNELCGVGAFLEYLYLNCKGEQLFANKEQLDQTVVSKETPIKPMRSIVRRMSKKFGTYSGIKNCLIIAIMLLLAVSIGRELEPSALSNVINTIAAVFLAVDVASLIFRASCFAYCKLR